MKRTIITALLALVSMMGMCQANSDLLYIFPSKEVYHTISPETPLYIFKNNQILLSILPRDYSFIAEDNLQVIFGILSKIGIRVNLMQNSALSFSICIDNNPQASFLCFHQLLLFFCLFTFSFLLQHLLSETGQLRTLN